MTNTDTTAKYLNRDDLYLLMESYRNMIDMHNALVNQQKEIIRNQNKSEERDIKSSAELSQRLYTLDRVLESLGVCISQHEKLIGDVAGQKAKITEPVIAKVDSIKTIIDSNHLDLTKQHATLQHKIYISMVGMATIILALIGLGFSLIEKYDILKDIYQILKALNITGSNY